MNVVGFLLGVLGVLFFFWVFPLFFRGIPWQPTDMRRVRRMLEMARVQPGEVVYDLGCGDGRIVICAVREFQAKAVGIELNPWLFCVALLRVFFLGLRPRARIIFGNIFSVDLRAADVVTLFLFEHVNEALKEKLERELKRGARIVSYVWTFRGWIPKEVDPSLRLYLYVKNDEIAS
jgi:cyclopropane fatty-acyl-phospholipid synthase-like methyltransferase